MKLYPVFVETVHVVMGLKGITGHPEGEHLHLIYSSFKAAADYLESNGYTPDGSMWDWTKVIFDDVITVAHIEEHEVHGD